jgi:transposase
MSKSRIATPPWIGSHGDYTERQCGVGPPTLAGAWAAQRGPWGGLRRTGCSLSTHVAPLIPPAKHGGRKRKGDVREVVNGIMDVLSTGCQWRYVPKDLPSPPAIPLGFAKRNLWPASPKSTLFDYFDFWNYDGTLENIHHA